VTGEVKEMQSVGVASCVLFDALLFSLFRAEVHSDVGRLQPNNDICSHLHFECDPNFATYVRFVICNFIKLLQALMIGFQTHAKSQ
jgi:hypothetical protein